MGCLPTVRKCCCNCCTLKTGNLVLGWILAIITALGVIMSGVSLASISKVLELVEEEIDLSEFDFDLGDILRGYFGGLLGLNIVNFILNVLLIIGANKSKAGLLLPWLIWHAIEILLVVAFGVVQLVFGIFITGILTVAFAL